MINLEYDEVDPIADATFSVATVSVALKTRTRVTDVLTIKRDDGSELVIEFCEVEVAS